MAETLTERLCREFGVEPPTGVLPPAQQTFTREECIAVGNAMFRDGLRAAERVYLKELRPTIARKARWPLAPLEYFTASGEWRLSRLFRRDAECLCVRPWWLRWLG